ncbi:MAG: N-acetylmuramoyl-L-alanine amidase [Chlamydiae bacterium]|nr:N-acetylmuramoyl-L-alanine amidase [Chlamydiota bacterium]
MQRLVFIFALICWVFSPVYGQKTFSGSSLISRSQATIIIDIGHGGPDRGARASGPFCEEKRICLQTGRLVKKYLDQLGYRVILTRATDVYISLPRRVEMADQARASLFVSIHYNSAPSSQAKGIEVFYPESGKQKVRSAASKKLAQTILSRVIQRTSAISRGVKKGNFFVIRETSMPAVIVEGGFISNAEERSCLKDHTYIDKIARGVADGIDLYYRGRIL